MQGGGQVVLDKLEMIHLKQQENVHIYSAPDERMTYIGLPRSVCGSSSILYVSAMTKQVLLSIQMAQKTRESLRENFYRCTHLCAESYSMNALALTYRPLRRILSRIYVITLVSRCSSELEQQARHLANVSSHQRVYF